MREFYRRLFHYDAWATGRVIDALARQGVSAGRPVELLAHILIARRLWLARIRGEDTSQIPIWPKLSLDQCRALYDESIELFDAFLVLLTEYGDRRRTRYRNTAGQEFDSTIDDVFLHMSHHAAYHRGQIAIQIREMGLQPPNTDFITYARGL